MYVKQGLNFFLKKKKAEKYTMINLCYKVKYVIALIMIM